MPRYNFTSEYLERLRRRYEEDLSVSVASIAAEAEIGERLVYRLARKHNWRMRSHPRELPKHVQLADAAKALVSQEHAPPPLPPASVVPPDAGTLSPQAGRGENALDRLEQLVLNAIAIEEAERASLGPAPRKPSEAMHKARAYRSHLDTLQEIGRERMRQNPQPATADKPEEPIPDDIDEFRLALARRIDAFVAGWTDARHAGEGGESDMVDETR
jgi:hypothetical protein